MPTAPAHSSPPAEPRRAAPAATFPARSVPLRERRRRIQGFFRTVVREIVVSEVLLTLPLLRRFRAPALPRWQRLSAEYREMAVELGGLWIKLGQFLSTRVDILPPEVTEELASLRDQVPPVSLEAITRQVEADFGRPLADVFPWFSEEAIGSASLAQVHRARLPSGSVVAVKVLRPGVEDQLELDLQVLGKAVRRLRHLGVVRRRVHLEILLAEFTTVSRKELDLAAEGHSIERFGREFASDPQVHVPGVHWECSGRHVLTLEEVSYIRLDDFHGLDAAGISRAAVARKVFSLYLQQFFVTHFVHADPHPGNLFIRPLPHAVPHGEGGDAASAAGDGCPFQVVFIDFGMVVEIPQRLRRPLRDYAIGLGTGDARRILRSYLDAGTLLPDADLTRMEALLQIQLDRYRGTFLGLLGDLKVEGETGEHLVREYQSLMKEAPVQFQSELLFVVRAMGVVAGIIARLDPHFDPAPEILPVTRHLLQEELQQNAQGWLQESAHFGRLARLPRLLDDVLSQAQQGGLTVRNALTPESERALRRLERGIHGLGWVAAGCGLLLAGVLWQAVQRLGTTPPDRYGLLMIGAALLCLARGLLRRD
jgi:predicted unusual protein kinase regulating ubiquinone biosynthesis (AarF/ABC1/UbiB family)